MYKKTKWENIDKLDDCFITYILYKEGKSIKVISKIRRMSTNEVQKDIIKSKMMLSNCKQDKKNELIEVISMTKDERIKYLSSLNEEKKEKLSKDVYKNYIKFKSCEDRMILIWLIGELKNDKLLPFLKMELRSPNVNYRRLACSALGKIRNKGTKKWLESALKDINPQVRQYAAKALSYIGDEETIKLLEQVVLSDKKEYVKRYAKKSLMKIKR